MKDFKIQHQYFDKKYLFIEIYIFIFLLQYCLHVNMLCVTRAKRVFFVVYDERQCLGIFIFLVDVTNLIRLWYCPFKIFHPKVVTSFMDDPLPEKRAVMVSFRACRTKPQWRGRKGWGRCDLIHSRKKTTRTLERLVSTVCFRDLAKLNFLMVVWF